MLRKRVISKNCATLFSTFPLMKLQDIKSLSQEELRQFLLDNGHKPYRAEQIRTWVENGEVSKKLHFPEKIVY
jgi:hypothetical protein